MHYSLLLYTARDVYELNKLHNDVHYYFRTSTRRSDFPAATLVCHGEDRSIISGDSVMDSESKPSSGPDWRHWKGARTET
jgi:hypothetical protein